MAQNDNCKAYNFAYEILVGTIFRYNFRLEDQMKGIDALHVCTISELFIGAVFLAHSFVLSLRL